MLTLEQVKNVLRIDVDDDDAYLTLAMQAAEEYIAAAVGRYPVSARADILALFLISNMYETRTFTVTADEEKQYIIRSMLLQLSLEEEEEET